MGRLEQSLEIRNCHLGVLKVKPSALSERPIEAFLFYFYFLEFSFPRRSGWMAGVGWAAPAIGEWVWINSGPQMAWSSWMCHYVPIEAVYLAG